MFSQKTRKSITNQENVDVLRPIICSLFLARDQQIVIFSANRNRNRFAGPSVRIGIGIVPEFQNLQIGIGIIFVRWEEFANYSQIPEIYFSFLFSKKIFFLTIIYFFHWKFLPGKQSHSDIHPHSLYIFNIRIRYSWIPWKIYVNRTKGRQITLFANRNIIHEMKLWRIGIGTYLWHKYQQIDSWQIYLGTICKLFGNRKLFAEHCFWQEVLHTGEHWMSQKFAYNCTNFVTILLFYMFCL